MEVDWNSLTSHVFANPRQTESILPSDWPNFTELKGCIWIATSGTSLPEKNCIKWTAITKEAFLESAHAVNTHIESSPQDVWANPLPFFHVGGLAIYARSFLSNAKVHPWKEKWSAATFYQFLNFHKVTLSSLVPAQLFDLIRLNLPSPPFLRVVIIGGGRLSEELYNQALSLDWPILPSYGMTECASQIATAHLNKPELQILKHIECKIDDSHTLYIKSRALFSGYLYIAENQFTWNDPKQDSWFSTDDLATINDGILHFLGRKSDQVKVGGENVSLFRLEKRFENLKPSFVDAILIASTHERLEYQIEAVTTPTYQSQVEQIVTAFNELVMPYERIRNIKIVSEIPRNALGKVQKSQL